MKILVLVVALAATAYYVVGSLPGFAKLAAFLSGYHGSRNEGIRKMELVAERGEVNKIDAQLA